VFLFRWESRTCFSGWGAQSAGLLQGPAEDEEAEIAGPIEIDESEQNYRGPRRPGAGGAA